MIFLVIRKYDIFPISAYVCNNCISIDYNPFGIHYVLSNFSGRTSCLSCLESFNFNQNRCFSQFLLEISSSKTKDEQLFQGMIDYKQGELTKEHKKETMTLFYDSTLHMENDALILF